MNFSAQGKWNLYRLDFLPEAPSAQLEPELRKISLLAEGEVLVALQALVLPFGEKNPYKNLYNINFRKMEPSSFETVG